MTAEAIIIGHLAERLPDVPVSGEVPTPRPARFVTVEKTGGGVRNRVTSATLAVQSWAESRAEAMELNERVKTAMERATELDSIMSCRLNSDYNYTDMTSKKNRYQAVFNVVYCSA